MPKNYCWYFICKMNLCASFSCFSPSFHNSFVEVLSAAGLEPANTANMNFRCRGYHESPLRLHSATRSKIEVTRRESPVALRHARGSCAALALRRYCYARSLHTRDNVFTASAIGQHRHGQLSYYSNYCASCDAGKNASVTRRHFLTICRLSCASINSESIP